MKDKLGIRGFAKFKLEYPDGSVLETGWCENTITNLGKKAVVGLTGNVDSQTAFTYRALGTDADPAPAAADTTLNAELTTLGLSRTTATVTSEQTTTADDTLRFVKAFTATGSTTVLEAGIFNASSTGVMLSRVLASPTLPVVNGTVLTITYEVRLS